LKILTDFDVFLYWRDDSKVNSFFNLFAKDQNFMNTIQNIRSVFTDLSTDFSTSKIVDNVHNFVYNFIFSLFRLFSMWITFFRETVFYGFLWKLFCDLGILYIRSFYVDGLMS